MLTTVAHIPSYETTSVAVKEPPHECLGLGANDGRLPVGERYRS